MSARAPRRRFASPFVVTLAAAGTAACTTSPPQSRPVEPAPTTGTGPDVEPTPGSPAGPKARVWTVTKIKGQAECLARMNVDCPNPKPKLGTPVASCNPPAPAPYTCPEGLADGQTMQIVLRDGATECFEQPPPMKGPPNVVCNPPPPRKVECPKH